MLETIVNNLNVVSLNIATVYLIFFVIAAIDDKSINTKMIRIRILIAVILFVLYITEVILKIILGKSIEDKIICAIIWFIGMVIECFDLKITKEEVNCE